MHIEFEPQALQKLKYYIKNTTGEVSGLGDSFIDREIIYITDLFLLPQKCNAANTELDQDAIGKLIYKRAQEGTLESLNVWFHSHANMSVFWSPTDDATIEDSATQKYQVQIVANKAGDILSRLDIFKPIRVTVDKIPWLVAATEDPALEKICRKELNDNLETRTYKLAKKIKNKNFLDSSSAVSNLQDLFEEDPILLNNKKPCLIPMKGKKILLPQRS